MLKQDVNSRTAEELVPVQQVSGLASDRDITEPATRRGLSNQAVPSTKVAGRRRFTLAYKRRIVEQVDACSQPGEIGALLRREGLYSSNLATFRKQVASATSEEGAGAGNKQARQERAVAKQKASRAIARLECENLRLRAIIDIQKKVCDLLNLPTEEVPPPSGRS